MLNYLYILHFDEPLHHAMHYAGNTACVLQRLTQHANGGGARITQVLHERALHWQLAALYQCDPNENSYRLEKGEKQQHQAQRACPLCNPEKYRSPHGTIEIDLSLLTFHTTSQELRK